MNRSILTSFATIAFGLVVLASPISAATFGLASDFNIFSFGSASYTNLTIGGRIAAGGAISLNSFQVGPALTANASRADVIAGGSVVLNNGSLAAGSVSVAGASLANSVGFIVPGAGIVTQASPIDFIAAKNDLSDLSTDLALLTANGQFVEQWGGLFFTGTASDLNVFTVDASKFAGKNNIKISAPAGSTVVINITGGNMAYQYAGFQVEGVSASNIVWNYSGTGSLSITGTGWQGSVLAPNASVTTLYGDFYGQLIASTVSSNGTKFYNNASFAPELGDNDNGTDPGATVPEPSTAVMLLSGLGALAVGVRRRMSRR